MAFEVWRHWLEGAKFPVEVHTDHRNLEHLKTQRKLNQRQQRWALFFERFNFRIHYVTPAQTKQADALSRKPEYTRGEEGASEAWLLKTENFASVRTSPPKPPGRARAPDPGGGSPPKETLEKRIRLRQAEDAWAKEQLTKELQFPFHLKDNLLCRRDKVYVSPGPEREEILKLCHDSRPAGHFGLFKTVQLVLRDFWWPQVRRDIEKYVRTCPVCHRAKHQGGKPAGLLQPLPTPSGPWQLISADFITDLPKSKGYTSILVVVDLFTKMSHFIPCVGVPTAKETADLFVQHVFRSHGLPRGIVTDRGTQFTSQFWKAVQKLLGIETRMSSAHHPQTDGQTERTNATLEQYLRCYVNYQQNNWAPLLAMAEFAYNNATQGSLKETPFFANYGYHPRFYPPVVKSGEVPAAEDWLQELSAIQELLKQQLDQAKSDYKRMADQHRQEGPEIHVGDRVWLSTKNLPLQRPCRKLDARFVGPYKVLEKVGPVSFKLQLPPQMKIHPVFHRSLLRPARGVRPDVTEPPPPPVMRDGEEECEVQDILDARLFRRKLQYFIDWKGQGPEERSWVYAKDCHAPDLVARFHRRHPEKPRPRGRPRRGLRGGDSVGTQVPFQPIAVGQTPAVPAQPPIPLDSDEQDGVMERDSGSESDASSQAWEDTRPGAELEEEMLSDSSMEAEGGFGSQEKDEASAVPPDQGVSSQIDNAAGPSLPSSSFDRKGVILNSRKTWKKAVAKQWIPR